MSEAEVERWVGALWGEGRDRVFAVLDGARDPAIAQAIASSGLRSACLLSGELAPELARAAPRVVELRRDVAFVRRVLASARGQSWGVFFETAVDLEHLRRHLKSLLRACDARGRTSYFRFYDPRILRVYLPTCTDPELRAFFGPAVRVVAEGEDRATMIEYRAGPSLVQIPRALGDAASA